MSVEGLDGSVKLPGFDDLQPELEPHAADGPHAAPLSDDEFRSLFRSDSPSASDLDIVESGLSVDLLSGGDLSAFAFDSLVDFDAEPVGALDAVVEPPSVGLPDENARQTAGVQPCLGASTSRCDGQGIAASG